MEAPGCVDKHYVGFTGLGRRQSIVHHGPRVSTALVSHHFTTHSAAPLGQLFDGSCTEGVPCHQQWLLTQLLEVPSDLADRGGLARAVHTHHQDHRR